MTVPERITLERVGDTETFRVSFEGGDVEAHQLTTSRVTLEPAGADESGQTLFRLTGEDAEGHRVS